MLLCACMCQVETCGNQNTSNNSTGCLPRDTQLYTVVRFLGLVTMYSPGCSLSSMVATSSRSSLATCLLNATCQSSKFIPLGITRCENSFPYLLFTLLFLLSLVDVFAHYQLNFARFRKKLSWLYPFQIHSERLCAGWPKQIGKAKQRHPFWSIKHVTKVQ